MQQYVFKCVRSHTTSPIQCAWEGEGRVNVPHSFLFLIHLIWGLQWQWLWLAGWLVYLLHSLSFMIFYSLPQIKLRNAIAIWFQNLVSVQRQFYNYHKCSRNICDLLMSRCQPSYYYYYFTIYTTIQYTMYNDQDRYSLENAACWPSKSLKIFKKIPNYAMSTFLYLYDGHNEGEMKFGELCFYSPIL